MSSPSEADHLGVVLPVPCSTKDGCKQLYRTTIGPARFSAAHQSHAASGGEAVGGHGGIILNATTRAAIVTFGGGSSSVGRENLNELALVSFSSRAPLVWAKLHKLLALLTCRKELRITYSRRPPDLPLSHTRCEHSMICSRFLPTNHLSLLWRITINGSDQQSLPTSKNDADGGTRSRQGIHAIVRNLSKKPFGNRSTASDKRHWSRQIASRNWHRL